MKAELVGGKFDGETMEVGKNTETITRPDSFTVYDRLEDHKSTMTKNVTIERVYVRKPGTFKFILIPEIG